MSNRPHSQSETRLYLTEGQYNINFLEKDQINKDRLSDALEITQQRLKVILDFTQEKVKTNVSEKETQIEKTKKELSDLQRMYDKTENFYKDKKSRFENLKKKRNSGKDDIANLKLGLEKLEKELNDIFDKQAEINTNLVQHKQWRNNFINTFDPKIIKSCKKFLAGANQDEFLCQILTYFVQLLREPDKKFSHSIPDRRNVTISDVIKLFSKEKDLVEELKNFKLEEIELGFENDLYAKVTTFREKIDHPDESVKAKNKNLYEHFLYFIHIITLLSSLYRNIHKGNLKLAKKKEDKLAREAQITIIEKTQEDTSDLALLSQEIEKKARNLALMEKQIDLKKKSIEKSEKELMIMEQDGYFTELSPFISEDEKNALYESRLDMKRMEEEKQSRTIREMEAERERESAREREKEREEEEQHLKQIKKHTKLQAGINIDEEEELYVQPSPNVRSQIEMKMEGEGVETGGFCGFCKKKNQHS